MILILFTFINFRPILLFLKSLPKRRFKKYQGTYQTTRTHNNPTLIFFDIQK